MIIHSERKKIVQKGCKEIQNDKFQPITCKKNGGGVWLSLNGCKGTI